MRVEIDWHSKDRATLTILLLSLVFGLYVGIFECLIGGIANIISWHSGNVDVSLFWNVFKVVFFPVLGMLCTLPGLMLAACVSYLFSMK